MRPHSLRRDAGASIDVPFKLLLSVVLMALAAMVLFPVLESYQQSEVEHRVQLVVSNIDSAARAVAQHPGSSRTVLVDVPPSGRLRLERLTIGADLGEDGPEVALIRWRMSSGDEGHHVVTSAAGPLPMAGPDGGPLTVLGDRCLLAFEAKAAPPNTPYDTFVEVRVL